MNKNNKKIKIDFNKVMKVDHPNFFNSWNKMKVNILYNLLFFFFLNNIAKIYIIKIF